MMDQEKALEIHSLIMEHVCYSVLGMGSQEPKKIDYSLLELCQAVKIVKEIGLIRDGEGRVIHRITISDRTIAAIYVANNYEPCNEKAILSYPNSHLVLVDNKVVKKPKIKKH